MTGFGEFHPIVLFLYFALILLISMFSMNPVVLGFALLGALVFFAAQSQVRIFLQETIFYLLLIILFSMMNPLFVHNGETILFFMNGKAITLEAIAYGLMSSLLVIGVLIWCRCYSKILTTDKFLYLFSRTLPKIGLLLSMIFRFIPLFQKQIAKISSSQKTLGLYASEKVTDRICGGVRTFDCLLTWSMENSLDTADAMKSRGYGLPGRTSFTLFRFRKADRIMTAILVLLAVIIFTVTTLGGYSFYYYPVIKRIVFDEKEILKFIPVLIFYLIPGILEIRGRILWKY